MLALVEVLKLLVDVAGEVRAGVNEALDSEHQALPGFEMDTHGPEGDLELDDTTRRDLFFFVVWVVWDQLGTSLWHLGAM